MAARTVVRQPGEGDAIWMLNSLYTVKASSDETGGTLTAMEMVIPPGWGPPPHTHPGGESVYVLEGRVRYHIAGEVHEGGPGTLFHIPAGVEENFEPAGDGPVRILVLYTPGGVEKFFAEVGEPAQRHELPPPSETPRTSTASRAPPRSTGCTSRSRPGTRPASPAGPAPRGRRCAFALPSGARMGPPGFEPGSNGL